MYKNPAEFKKAVGDKIRGHLGVEDKFVTEQIPAKIDEVYAAGQAAGGGGGASDPAAEAVMALIRSTKFTYTRYELGMFRYAPRVENGIMQKGIVILPEQVTEIKEDLITTDCSIILCLPIIPPQAPWFGFWSPQGANQPPEVIYVPDDSVEAYKAAEHWSDFAHLIKPMSYLIPTEITFYVEDYSFTALLGMRWDDWFTSNYFEEIGVFISNAGAVCFRDSNLYKSSDMNTVIKATDEIQSGAVYTRSW